MKILNFRTDESDSPRLGVFENGKIIDVKAGYEEAYSQSPPDWFKCTDELLRGGSPALKLLSDSLEDIKARGGKNVMEEERIVYMPAVLSPSKMLMVGVNYLSHAPEPGAKPPGEPYVFIKLPNALLGHRGTINVPSYSRQPDNEIELAVIIGKRCKDVKAEDALDYVAGYSVMDDFSFRDLRSHPSPIHKVNWLRLKNLDNAAPLGPWISTRDEVKDPYNLQVKLEVNGEEQDSSTTELMTHKIPALIEYVSRGITLEPGDVISTGTPLKNGAMTGKFLKDGDKVKATIESVGILEVSIKFH